MGIANNPAAMIALVPLDRQRQSEVFKLLVPEAA
jgi:hypothetical protein